MTAFSRRTFLRGCSALVAAMAGARLNYVALGNPEQDRNREMLLVVFLRGGCDGLNIIAPYDGPDRGFYEEARPYLQLPTSGENPALRLGTLEGAQGDFGLHPRAAPLYELYQEGKVALVHAAGLNNDTRSHFDAMSLMERGITSGGLSTGWLTRHLQSATDAPTAVLTPAIGVGDLLPTSLLGSNDALGMGTPEDFSFYGDYTWGSRQRVAMRRMYTKGQGWIHKAGLETLNGVDLIESYYDPEKQYQAANGAAYPDSDLGRQLQTLAQVIKWDLGLRIATIDFGGWDTHEYQGDGADGYFGEQLGELTMGLYALYTDLNGAGNQDYTSRLTVVVMSEFGRRLRANDSGGTDHGHGNVMMVLGGNVTGGLKGTWPGLAGEQLYDGYDLAITTDYRRVLSEILIRRLGNPNLGAIFPTYQDYAPLGIVSGEDLAPVYESALRGAVI